MQKYGHLKKHRANYTLECDAIQKIGKVTPYQGGDVVPAILYPDQGIQALINSTLKSGFIQRRIRLKVLAFLLEDLASVNISQADQSALKNTGFSFLKGKEK